VLLKKYAIYCKCNFIPSFSTHSSLSHYNAQFHSNVIKKDNGYDLWCLNKSFVSPCHDDLSLLFRSFLFLFLSSFVEWFCFTHFFQRRTNHIQTMHITFIQPRFICRFVSFYSLFQTISYICYWTLPCFFYHVPFSRWFVVDCMRTLKFFVIKLMLKYYQSCHTKITAAEFYVNGRIQSPIFGMSNRMQNR
jgi:hypothetical protein